MKYKISVYVTLAFLLGANLAYASGVAIEDSRSSDTSSDSNSNDTTILSETGIVVMDTEGNCWVISADNHVDDCTSEQAEQVHRITTQAVSPKVLSETIPGDVAILAEEGKCVVVSKNEGSVDNCTEEQEFALQVLSESYETVTRQISQDGLHKSSSGIGLIALGVLALLVVPMPPPAGLVIGGGAILGGAIQTAYFVFTTLIENRWSDICNLEEHAKNLMLTLNGEDISPLEQIERLQIAYLTDSAMCMPSDKTLQELSQKVATADGFSPHFP